MRAAKKRSIRVDILKFISSLVVFFALSSLAFAATDNIVMLNEDYVTASQIFSYKSCVDGISVKHAIYCPATGNTKTLSTLSLEDNCYISSVDLEEFPCGEIELQSIFQKNGTLKKITKLIYPKKTLSSPENILESQVWDGGWGTPSATAYAIWILSTYDGEYEKQISEGLEWLKKNRLESEKCWPGLNGLCSPYDTAQTLLFLKYAGVNITEKVYQDGLKWIGSRQNFFENTPWELRILPQDDGSCTVEQDESRIFSDRVEEDELKKGIEFTPEYDALINVTCFDNSSESMGKRIYIYDDDERSIFSHYFDQDTEDYFDYKIDSDSDFEAGISSLYRVPPSCWSNTNKWQYCSRKTTLYALLLDEMVNLSDFDEDRFDTPREWLEEELRFGKVIGKYLPTENSILDTAIMLYDFEFSDTEDGRKNEAAVMSWLLHKQNNDGSWGDGTAEEKVRTTAFALLSLDNQTFEGKEAIMDNGLSWLSVNYPVNGWETFEDEAITFLLLKNTAKPYLKAEGLPVRVLNSDVSISVHNPTAFEVTNITTEILGDINGHLGVEMVSGIEKYGSKKIKLSPIKGTSGSYSGIVRVLSKNTTMLDIPVIYDEEVMLSIKTVKTRDHYFSEAGVWEFNVETNSPFSCNVTFDDENIHARSPVSITQSGSFNLKFWQDVPVSNVYSGNFMCAYETTKFEIPFDIEVLYYDTPPFMLDKKKIFIGEAGKNESLEIENLIDDVLEVKVDFAPESSYLTAPRNIVLQPKESKKIELNNFAVAIEGLTQTEETLLRFRAFDYKEIVDIQVEILPLGESRPSATKYIIIFIIVSVIGGVGYFYYSKVQAQAKEEAVEAEEQKQGKKEVPVTIKEKVKSIVTDLRTEVRDLLPEKYKKFVPKSKAEIALEEAKKKEAIQKTHLKDMVVVMKKLDKSDAEIVQKLESEGLEKDEIQNIIKMVEMDSMVEESLKSEEESMKIVQLMDENKQVRNVLESQGFSGDAIAKTFEEIEGAIKEKEAQIKKESGEAPREENKKK